MKKVSLLFISLIALSSACGAGSTGASNSANAGSAAGLNDVRPAALEVSEMSDTVATNSSISAASPDARRLNRAP